MIFVDIVPASAGQVSTVIKGRIRGTGASAATLLVALAKQYPAATTLYAPKAMSHCMKTGDMSARGDTNSAAAPAYASNRR